MRVLLVEDDAMIGDAVELALRMEAYAVDRARDGIVALQAFRAQRYDLVLLDLGLPGLDGMEVLGAMRAGDDPVPVLVITARDAIEARINGLDLGADDYVLKPFDMGELLARMRALLRRKGGVARAMLGNGTLTLDPATREAGGAHGPVRLSGREFALLQALLIRPGAILSRSQLEERIYGWNEEVESNAVEFLIHGLRKKLGSDAIKNVRGVGWMVDREG
ncbi:response regulator [Paludibacterium yongneupense]|uniref:response regulator n=1 Tax=Paludibacterium yongneupense TaxID=400061 RepID=UPI0003FD2AE1|nr:response regulator transcription factor [Paludibacterium yongneupense]